jgi:hypothetical protein
MRIDPTSRIKTSRESKKKPISKTSAPNEKSSTTQQIEVPDRMHIIFRDNPANRWLVLTPKEYNAHHSHFVALPVTLEKSHLCPFEYQFVLDRVSMIALAQPRTILLTPPYVAMGRLSRIDHEQISKIIFKLIGEPNLAINL